MSCNNEEFYKEINTIFNNMISLYGNIDEFFKYKEELITIFNNEEEIRSNKILFLIKPKKIMIE